MIEFARLIGGMGRAERTRWRQALMRAEELMVGGRSDDEKCCVERRGDVGWLLIIPYLSVGRLLDVSDQSSCMYIAHLFLLWRRIVWSGSRDDCTEYRNFVVEKRG